MTQEELINLGFKKKKTSDGYWFELNKSKHQFITNDTFFNKFKDDWFVGYRDKTQSDEHCWFNSNLKNIEDLKLIINIVTKKK